MLPAEFSPKPLCMPRSNGQRLLSASLAVSISLFFLAQLHQDFLRTNLLPDSPVARIMLLNFPSLIPPNSVNDKPVTNTANTAILATQTKRPQTRLQDKKTQPAVQSDQDLTVKHEAKPTTELITVFPDTPSTKATNGQTDTLSGSSRFQYDRSAARQAYEESKSEIQKLAEKSGKSLEDPKLSKHDRFQQAANRAAKADCLRQGGSILSLFVVAYQVATDHCK